MTLYNAKSVPDAMRITKFNDDLEVESSYIVTRSTCECPAHRRHSCRHREMFPQFKGRIDTGWFLEYETGKWFFLNQGDGTLMPKQSWRRI